jgi:DNA polymerase-3 subunit gamma/tau
LLAIGNKRITSRDVNQLLGIAPAERLAGLVRKLVARDARAALGEFDAALRDGVEVGLLLDQLVGYFRDVMAVAAGCGPDQMLYALPSQAGDVVKTGRQLGLPTVLAIGQILDQTASRMRISMHGRTLVEMAVVRICQLGELDDLATVVAELRGMAGENGTATPTATTPTAKKNVESPPLSPPAAMRSLEPIPTMPQASEWRQQRTDSSHSTHGMAPSAEAGASETTASNADSVLAQWQRAVASGQAVANDLPPRVSRREQLAALSDRPIVRRAMELFDVPAGQLRYTPPENDSH